MSRPEDIDIIMKSRDILHLTWKQISLVVGRSEGSCRKAYARRKVVKPPTVRKKRVITSQIADEITAIVKSRPNVTIREVSEALKAKFPEGVPLPKRSAIHSFMQPLKQGSSEEVR